MFHLLNTKIHLFCVFSGKKLSPSHVCCVAGLVLVRGTFLFKNRPIHLRAKHIRMKVDSYGSTYSVLNCIDCLIFLKKLESTSYSKGYSIVFIWFMRHASSCLASSSCCPEQLLASVCHCNKNMFHRCQCHNTENRTRMQKVKK
jgi:hypothetical protein